jgi:SAM-dependent methyltransferase
MCAFTSWGYFLNDEDNLQQLMEYSRVIKPGGALIIDLAGRHYLEEAIRLLEGFWYRVSDGDYKERVRWTQDKRRIITDRIKDGHRFRHNIWIPGDDEIRAALLHAGFEVDCCWGGLEGEAWVEMSERWVYRAICKKGK